MGLLLSSPAGSFSALLNKVGQLRRSAGKSRRQLSKTELLLRVAA
jgi:hypothetical protein